MSDPKKSRVPEVAMAYNRSRGEDKTKELIDDDLIEFLKDIKGANGIELMGRLGFISEYLSQKGNTVRLVDEERMFFVYRGHIFRKSNVIEMNIHPNSINPSIKYYDFAIVHSDEFLDLANKIADTVYHIERMEVYRDGKIVINNNENKGKLPEDEDHEKGDREHDDSDHDIPDSIEY
jgi:hypothetical protein